MCVSIADADTELQNSFVLRQPVNYYEKCLQYKWLEALRVKTVLENADLFKCPLSLMEKEVCLSHMLYLGGKK